MKRYERYKPSGIEWIGEIPEHWDIKKLKYCFKFQTGWTPPTGKSEYYEGGSHIWVTIADMDKKIISDSAQKITDKAIEDSKMQITSKGSLLYSFKLSVGKVSFVKEDVYTNEAIFSIFPERNVNLKFFYYSLPDQLIINSNENIYGAKLLNQELIKNARLIIPKEKEQTVIADYLDHKTAQIDDLISKKQKLIDLLNEEKTAIINQVVTKGLNTDAPMKNSGIPWLGEIPAHWEVKKLKYVARLQSGDGITSDLISEEGPYPVFGGNGLRGYTSSFTHEGDYVLIGRQGALCGNINYASGRFWASEHAIVATACGAYVCLWFGELLRTMNLNQYSQSAAQPGLSVERIQNLFIPVPPLEEQRIIAHLIETSTKTTDAIISKIENESSLLQEYRSALISEAVTGKIDVRGAS